jgi:GTP-binding protein
LKALKGEGQLVSEGKCTKIILRQGLSQNSVEEAGAGEIVSIAGLDNAFINQTLCSPEVSEPLPFQAVDAPTISMTFYVNDSPLGGREGKFLTSQNLRDRLYKEAETNIALQIKDANEAFEVKGRGELQMGVLIETMRREGFEMSVSPPRVIYKAKGQGRQREIFEPIEEVTMDVDPEHTGVVIEKMSKRKGDMKSFADSANGKTRLIFQIPTRGLLGYPAEFKNDTHGQGVLNHMLVGYEPFKGTLDKTRKGSIISMASGEATAYTLKDVEARYVYVLLFTQVLLFIKIFNSVV